MVRTESGHRIIGLALTVVCLLLGCIPCKGAIGRDTIEANVLIYWPTDESDPVYKEWTGLVIKELRRQGIKGNVEVHYAHATERYESTERPMFIELIMKLRVQGKKPDLIISYSDINKWLLTTITSPVITSIPIVCFGLRSDKFLPYQYEMLENDYNGGRTDNMVQILNPLHLKETLEMADAITPAITEYIRTPEFYSLQAHRFITMLDVEALWNDRIAYNELVRQMGMLDPQRFYNNLEPKVDEGTLNAFAQKQNKIVFSCRSVINPKWNVPTTFNQIATPWAFYPQKSPNYFIQSKHDNKTRGLVEGPSFMPYFTMVAEDFLVNPKCVGGYFSTAQDQIKDAVNAGLRILRGEKPEDIGLLESLPSWNINWDVLRPMGLDVNLVPSFVSLHNDKLEDRNPQLYIILVYTIIIGLALLMIWSGIVIFIYSRRARKNAIKLRDYANETISNNKALEQMMAIADFRTWEYKEGDTDENQFNRISTSDFFMDKLHYFLHIGKPGNYNLQIHCSIDDKPATWYELRMTVSRENGKIVRRGIIINIESQKEVEAMAAETNRLINSVRTREGFIASMNHEIRTPLNSVVGYSQLLAMVDMPLDEEEIKEYGNTIKENTAILQNTINNILTSNKIEKGLINPAIEKYRLSDIILPEHIYELEQDENDRIVLEQCDRSLFVMADVDMLKTVIENLLSNALRFSDPSSKVTVGWAKCDDPVFSAEIVVRDEGIGIASEYFELLFDRFFKVDSFTPGCGLGLYICKTFVEIMGGQISVESKVGEGSVFKIKLP